MGKGQGLLQDVTEQIVRNAQEFTELINGNRVFGLLVVMKADFFQQVARCTFAFAGKPLDIFGVEYFSFHVIDDFMIDNLVKICNQIMCQSGEFWCNGVKITYLYVTYSV